MRRRRRVALIAVSVVGGVSLIALLTLLFFTQTGPGREQVRRFALQQLDRATDGEISIRRIEGNLLRKARLVDVSIVDEQRRPFVAADTIATRFSLRGLLRRRIALTDVELIGADVVLDKPPGEAWNYVRIFRVDPDTVPVEPAPPGWGDWIALDDVRVTDSRVTVRTAWEPPDDLNGPERERALRRALAGETRDNVVEVPGGYQNVMEFRELSAEVSRVLIAHPDTVGIPIDIEHFSGIVQPFQPPVAVVEDLAGNVRIANDSLYFNNIVAELPGSRITAEGVYALHSGELLLHMDGAPLAFADMRWIYPPLPDAGGGETRVTIHRRSLTQRIIAYDMDLAVGDATLQGRLDLTTGDTVRLGETDLVFARVPVDLVENFLPALEFPQRGQLTGRLALLGPPAALELDGDIAFDPVVGQRSRIVAAGEVGIGEDMRFRDLRMRFQPLQAELARAFIPEIPVRRGTIEGFANLTGRPDAALQLDTDLTIRDAATGLSRVRAAGGVDTRGELTLRDLAVRVDPLQADLVRDAAPMLPAGATLAGQVRLDGQPRRRLQVDGVMSLFDPATGTSRVGAQGAVALGEELRFDALDLRLDPLQLDLVRERFPQLPAGATLVGPVRLHGVPARQLNVDGDVALHDPASGTSRFGATGGVAFNGAMRFDDMALRLHSVQIDMLRQELPDLPPGGLLSGRVRLNGEPTGLLDVTGEITHDDARLGTSRIAADGGIRFVDGLLFRDLDLRFSPLSMALVRGFAPDLPLGGTLNGTATLNGSPDARITVNGDVVHQERGERSHVIGSADIVTGPGGRATVDVTLQPLSLSVAGRFVPAAGLHGSVAGRLTASGDLGDLVITTDLQVADGGSIRVDGTLDLASPQPGYDVDVAVTDFDLAAVTWRAPATTALTGTAFARGRGVEPATMDATLFADMRGVAVDGQSIDYVRLDARLAGGLAVLDSSIVRLGTAEALVDGSFGLVGWQTGTLAYRIAVDSLHQFSPWVPLDIETGPPPAFVADNGWAGDYLVPEGPNGTQPADTADVPLGGRLLAEGTAHGNVERFDIDGRADVENFSFDGNYIGRGRADYDIRGFGTELPHITVAAGARDVRAGGVAFDSAGAWVRYEGERYGTGRAIFAAYQNAETEYSGDIEFALSLERSELQLADLTLRFDTITWQLTEPATVAWGGEGVDVTNLDLVSDAGGRIRIDGTLPIDGTGDFDVDIVALEIGQIAELLQLEQDATGILDLEARVEGTQRAPRVAGAFQLRQATLDGETVPDAQATFTYANQRLELDGTLLDGFRELAVVTASLPLDLALTPGSGQRLLPGEVTVDIVADELQLGALPGITDLLEDVEGSVTGNIAIRGTFDDPILSGEVDLDIGELRVVPLGVTFENVAGALSMEGSVLRVDSLVAHSRGEIRVDGTVDFTTLAEPVFALSVTAEDARVIDNGDARFDVDADLRIEGPADEIAVTGNVHTRRGVLWIPPLAEFGSGEVVNLDDPGTFEYMENFFEAERERLFAHSPLLQRLNIDIGLTADRNVWVRSTEANVEIYTPQEVGPLHVQLNGADQSISLLGTLNTDRGEYEFMSRRFRLTRGAATFVGGSDINPMIQVAAEHEVRLPGREGFEVRVVLSGELRDLQIALESTSQPPISQTDLLAYIAFGRDAASLLYQQGSALAGQGAGTGELVGNVAALATQQLAAVALEAAVNALEAGAMRDLGVDVFRITPADIPAELFTGDFEDALLGTEIEAGRYVTDRLFVATHLRYALRPGLRLEYWTRGGFQWRASWMPRFLPLEPTLTERDLAVRSVLGGFLFREWRF